MSQKSKDSNSLLLAGLPKAKPNEQECRPDAP